MTREEPFTIREVRFTGALGAELTGSLEMPAGTPRAYAIFAHCFTCDRRSHATRRVSVALAEHGIAVLRFDFTGLGDSDGRFAESTFTSNVGDLVAAADWLAQEHEAPRLLVGHSFGGAAVLAAAGDIDSVMAVATIAAPADPDHVAGVVRGATRTEQGDYEVRVGGRPFHLGQEFLDDIAGQPQQERISTLRRPLLLLHSPADEVVGVDNAQVIFAAARHPTSFIALDGADHLLSRRADAQFAASMIATWAERYLEAPQD